MNRLTRHIVAEIFELFLAVLIGITLIIISFRFASLLAEAAKGEIIGSAIFKLLGLYAVGATEYLIPFSFFIAAVAVLVRYSMSGEYIAMRALGFGHSRVKITLIFAATPVALGLLYLSFAIYPSALDLSFKMLDQAREKGETSLIQPGQFRNLGNQTILYVGKSEDSSTKKSDQHAPFQHFFLYQFTRDSEAITTAGKGKIIREQQPDGTEKRTLELSDGMRLMTFHAGERKNQALSVYFPTLKFHLPDIEIDSRPNKIKTKPTGALFADPSIRAKSEIQRRIATALSIPILALVSWLLISDKPRRSHYVSFGYAILFYLLYNVNQTIVVGLTEKNAFPLFPGAYFIPTVVFLAYLFFARKRTR